MKIWKNMTLWITRYMRTSTTYIYRRTKHSFRHTTGVNNTTIIYYKCVCCITINTKYSLYLYHQIVLPIKGDASTRESLSLFVCCRCAHFDICFRICCWVLDIALNLDSEVVFDRCRCLTLRP
jgi:hypothetical protein